MATPTISSCCRCPARLPTPNYKLVLTASNSETVAPSNAGWSIANRGKIDLTGNTWTDGNIGKIEIKADARLLSAHSVTASSATLHLADYSGNWHYKYTSPSGGTCSSAQTGSTAALSALTAGASYTFKAYSDSGCATEIATADAFTTGVSVSNLSTINRYGVCKLENESSCAAAFTTGSASGGYALQSVTVDMGNSAGPSTVRGAVYAASGSNPAASALIDLGVFSQPTQGNHTLACDANCGLSANTTYFVVLSDLPNQSGVRQWNTTEKDDETKTPSNNGWSIADAGRMKESGGTWESLLLPDQTSLFLVKAHEGRGLGRNRRHPDQRHAEHLPPRRRLVVQARQSHGRRRRDSRDHLHDAGVQLHRRRARRATTVALTLDGQAGDWRYKRTAPTTGSCSAAVSTATTNITSLDSGTTYTYKAYDDATCATEVAAVSFTTATPTLTVTGVTHGSATLTIAGWTPGSGAGKDGNWRYKRTSPAGGTCSAAQTGASATLSLVANTADYTFKAYSDSTCATEIAAADAFSTVALLSNLGDTDDDIANVRRTSGQNRSVAAGFRAGSQSGGYTLKSVAVNVQLQTFQPDTFSMAIHRASGGAPAASAEFVVSSALISGSGKHTVTCSGTCNLDADTDYFLVLKGVATGFNNFAYFFRATTNENWTASPASDGWSISDQGKFRWDDGSWQDEKTTSNEALVLKFELKADVNPALSASSVSAGGATLNLSHHTAAWWYKRTTPSGDDTCHSVAAGTTDASLSSLTANTPYTYKAYDKTGCNSADEIATVTFTTTASGNQVGTTVVAGWRIERDAAGVLKVSAKTNALPTGGRDTATPPAPGSRDAANDVTALAAAGNTSPDGIWSDGATLWVVDADERMLYAYHLATKARDPGKDVILSRNTRPLGLTSDGATMWVSDYQDGQVYAYDLATGAPARSRDVTLHAANASPSALWTDGATLWAAEDTAGRLYAYRLPDSTPDPAKDLTLHADNAAAGGLWSDGVTMWVSDPEDGRVYAYRLSDGGRDASREYDAGGAAVYGLWSDGRTTWLADDGSDRLLAHHAP